MDEGNTEPLDEKDQIGKLDIIVDLPMPELTNEEERHLADMKHHGSNVREEMKDVYSQKEDMKTSAK